MGGGFAGVENSSSSIESSNKPELGLALGGGAAGFVVFGFEENNSSSFFSSSKKSVPFFVAVGLTVNKK